jgi:hypothetical protein
MRMLMPIRVEHSIESACALLLRSHHGALRKQTIVIIPPMQWGVRDWPVEWPVRVWEWQNRASETLT